MTEPPDAIAAARALAALAAAPPFGPEPGGDGLDAIAAAAVDHCRRLLEAAARLSESGMTTEVTPLARAVFEAAVPLVWTLEDPGRRGPRYLVERGRATARLREAASRAGLLAAASADAVGRELRPRTRSDALPPFDRMARGIGLAREDVVLRRSSETTARGRFGASPLDGDPLRIASVVFARLAVAAARRLDGDGAVDVERRFLGVLAGDADAIAEALPPEAAPAPAPAEAAPAPTEVLPSQPEIVAETLDPEDGGADDDLATADGFAAQPEPAAAPRPRRSMTYVIVDGEQPRVIGPDDVRPREPDGEPVEGEGDELSDFLDTF